MTYPRKKALAPWPALPWRVVFTAFETEIRDARNILIARIPLAAGNRGVTAGAEEMRTYALLMALSPELLTMLKRVSWSLGVEMDKGEKGWEYLHQDIQRLIKRAKTGAP